MQLSATQILKEYWGFDTFRNTQNKVIQTVLAGANVLALMPTGGGKSICFQVPALAKPGICIVVSPLVALIQDQVNALRQKGIKAIGLTGGLPPREIDSLLDNCIHGNYKFLYLSPERLQQPLVKARILQMQVNLFAIDEAHCISEWGHDFRPAYRQCAMLKTLHPKAPLIALTATATPAVAQDIIENLEIPEAKVHKDSFYRANIGFQIIHKEDKFYALQQHLNTTDQSVIIYVASRRETVLLATQLNQLGKSAAFFHGGISSFEKKDRLKDWLADKFQIMVATNAFGMGVDKPNVALVVHYQIPSSLENYYQEAGRAGRNGMPAKAVLITNQQDKERATNQLLSNLPDLNYVKEVYKRLNAHFQIAYGEGLETSFYLDFRTFCEHYKLAKGKTYATLKLLDQNGILALEENAQEICSLQMVTVKEELFHWMAQHPKMGTIVQTTLRTYGGLFDFETKINLSLLSNKTGNTIPFINSTFLKLEKDGLALYKNVQHDLKLNFLKPREDQITINPIGKVIRQLNTTKKEKLAQMLAFLEQKDQCRVIPLLQYFGETHTTNCSRCDVCQKNLNNKPNPRLSNQLLLALQEGDKSSRELLLILKTNEPQLLALLKAMLEKGAIILKNNNTYGIRS